jgi:hypothetical protein
LVKTVDFINPAHAGMAKTIDVIDGAASKGSASFFIKK